MPPRCLRSPKGAHPTIANYSLGCHLKIMTITSASTDSRVSSTQCLTSRFFDHFTNYKPPLIAKSAQTVPYPRFSREFRQVPLINAERSATFAPRSSIYIYSTVSKRNLAQSQQEISRYSSSRDHLKLLRRRRFRRRTHQNDHFTLLYHNQHSRPADNFPPYTTSREAPTALNLLSSPSLREVLAFFPRLRTVRLKCLLKSERLSAHFVKFR